MISKIKKKINNHKRKKKVFSFDIFDTVLTRTTGSPVGIFHLMKDCIDGMNIDIPESLKENFCESRMQALEEAQSAMHDELESPTIAEIYAQLAKKFNLSDSVRDLLIKLEMEVELDAIRPIPPMVNLIKDLHACGSRIIFISDMHLPKDVIQLMLENAGAYKQGDTIYVSNEHSKTKRSGKLFEHVLDELGCQSSDVCHIGDNFKSDCVAAKKKGIKCLLFDESLPNKYETILLNKNSSMHNSLSEKIAGASRLARLFYSAESSRISTLHDLGANIAGPILFGYVYWVLQQAREKGLKRLYFNARDGQILLEIAKVIQTRMGGDIDLRYLYGSRISMYLPSVQKIDNEILDWLLLKNPFLNLKILANRLDVDPAIIQDLLEVKLDKLIKIEAKLKDTTIEAIKDLLKEGPLADLVMRKAERQRLLVSQYLRQEGLLDDVDYGIVDLGWRGTIQDSIKRVIDNTDPKRHKKLYGFYFGYNPSQTNEGIKDNHKIGYYFSPDIAQSQCPIRWEAMYIFEIITSADHGITLKFNLNDEGKVYPCLKEKSNYDAFAWGLSYLREGIFDFLKFLPLEDYNKIAMANNDNLRNLITPLLETLLYDSSKVEVAILGEFPLKMDFSETYSVPFAPQLTMADAIRYMFIENKKNITHWYRASCARSSMPVRYLIRVFNILSIKRIFDWLSTTVFNKKEIRKKHYVFLRRLPPNSPWGGCERQVLDYFLKTDYNANRITLATTEDIFSEKIKKKGLPLKILRIPFAIGENSYKSFKRMFSYLSSLRPDSVVFIQGGFTDFQLSDFLAAYILTRGKVYALEVLGASKPMERKSKKHLKFFQGVGLWWYKKMMPTILRGWLCKNIITVSEEMKERLVKWYCYPQKRIHTIYHGVNIQQFAPDAKVRNSLRKKFGVPEEDTIILSTARLAKVKRIDRLINVFDKLCAEFPNSWLFLVGDGPLRKELEELSRTKKNKHRIKFLGFQTNVAQFLKMSDVFVLPSDNEGLSNAMIEAMGSGLISVITRAPGAAEVVQDGKNGFLVECTQEDIFYGLVKAMSLKEKEKEKMVKNARRFVEEKFDVRRGTQKGLEILQLN